MGAILLDEQTAPGTPSTGQVVLYPKSDGFLYSKDDAGTETQLAVDGFTAASQAEQEAGSSTTVATTPGRQHFHPSAAKAWVRFNGTGTIAIDADYGVSSLTDGGTGDYTVNFDTNMNGSYSAMVCGFANSRPGGTVYWAQVEAYNAGSVVVLTNAGSLGAGTNAAFDAASVEVHIFGDH